jgi:poly(beta-D-mannuronate) C5 epimerase
MASCARVFSFNSLVVPLVLLLCGPAEAATFRYATSSNRIYVENGGSATLSDIKAALPKAPLDLVDPANHVWLLRANLQLTGGSTVVLHGSAAGGDVNELRLKSDNTDATSFVQVTADYGNLDLQNTKVISWDSAVAGPDTNYANGRAFIHVRSHFAADGVTPQESRMDVVDSEIGWLGYNAAEAYGLVWKVTVVAYDKVNVYGNILGSHIHNNYFGVYTFGHQDGLWRDNEVDHNAQYGFDPHDDSDNIVIENNDVHDNGNHGIIASQRCDHIVIRGNRSYGNTGNGVMLHRSSDDGLIEENELHDNGDSGIAIYSTHRTLIRNNVILRNANAGMRFSLGAADSNVQGNDIGFSGLFGLYFYMGTDTPDPGDDGRNKRNTFTGNRIHDTVGDTLKVGDSDATKFTGNLFENNPGRMRFLSTAATEFGGNTMPADTAISISGTSAKPSAMLFTSQPRVNFTQDTNSSVRFNDLGGAVFDPDEDVFTIIASSGGSTMTLTQGITGGASTVYTRAMKIVPSIGSATAQPLAWNTGANTDKQWVVRPSGGLLKAQYTVGDLVPGGSYRMTAATQVLLLTADGSGKVSFNSTITAQTIYALNRR